ncbi:MAG TPA: phosphatase PAP2 family protein [Gammaproteobacteria bacterium]|nr:phosphatase PAP2 family protein [Gammaproteobacteria bacterium]
MRASPWHYWLVPAVAMILLGTVITVQGNQTLFLGINQLSHYTGDTLWADLTIFGNGIVIVGLTLPLIGKRPEMILPVLIATLITALTVNGLKAYFHAPRPPAVLAADLFHVIGPAYRGGSFPSGHTATAFVFAGVVSLTFARLWVTLAVVALATAVGVSRMVVGVHWPVDVLAGAALGWACAVAAFVAGARWHRRAGDPRVQLWLSVPLYLTALALWWPHVTAYEAARPVQYAVALLALIAGAAAAPRLIRRARSGGRRPMED